MLNKFSAFLRDRRLTAEDFPLEQERETFLAELACGLRGQESSLAMIPAFLPAHTDFCGSGRVAVLDAGGTNLRVGAVDFLDGRPQRVQFEKYPLPGTDRALAKQDFFDAVAEKLLPWLEGAEKIGFCFSYAAECMENGDARIKDFCKEVKVTGARGAQVCRELKDAIARQGLERDFACVQLNDTVAAMLGAMADFGTEAYSAFLGVILGTGFNSCYGEKTENILKYTGAAYGHKTMVVNMETGSYTGFRGGVIDRRVDESSALPGDHLTEKMLSGAYLGKVLFAAMEDAKKEGFYTSDLSFLRGELPLWEANAFLAGEKSVLDVLAREEQTLTRTLITALYGRSARILAVLLTAVSLHLEAGTEKPVAVAMEGSTYEKSPLLRELLQEELALVKEKYGIAFKLLSAENATLKGAALAAVSAK